MQHLDEGTIHAWLDGALSPDEAARANAHVEGCPQCQAAVAEARGFIAASSRILTALDDAPRGVIPIAQKQRVQPWVWRVAATVLVVATGTVLLVKERGSDSRTMSNTADSTAPPAALTPAAPTTILSRQAAAADSTAAPRATARSATTQPATTQSAAAPAAIRAMSPAGVVSGVSQAPIRATSKQSASAGNADTRASDAARVDAPAELKSDVAPNVVTTGAATAPAPTAPRRAFGVVGGVAAGRIPREVGSRRTIASTQTFYEVAPGDTVVLEEQSSPQLQSVVVAQGAARAAQTQPTRPTEKSAAASVESQQKAAAASAPPSPVATLSDAQISERHSISWLDPSTRGVMILSGRHTQQELERIREQIQRLRAEQSKKNPE